MRKPKVGDRVKFIGAESHGVPFNHTGTIKEVYSLNVWVDWDRIPNAMSQTTSSSLRYYEFDYLPSDNGLNH